MPATSVPESDVRSSSTAASPHNRSAAAPESTSAAPRRYGPRRSGSAPHNRRSSNRRPTAQGGGRGGASDRGPAKAEDHEILFQKFFKSVGPRTYAAQVKKARNGNHYLVLMEGKRDESSGDVRKTRLFIYSEDFVEFFRLIKSAAEFIKEHPVPDDVREKQERYWAKNGGGGGGGNASGAVGLHNGPHT